MHPTFNDVQYAVGALGLFGVAVFAFFLSGLIFDARRESVADRYLAAVLFIWGIISLSGLYRIFFAKASFLPFINLPLWIISFVLEGIAAVYVLKERTGERHRSSEVVNRAERAVAKQEQVTERQARIVQKMEDDHEHSESSV